MNIVDKMDPAFVPHLLASIPSVGDVSKELLANIAIIATSGVVVIMSNAAEDLMALECLPLDFVSVELELSSTLVLADVKIWNNLPFMNMLLALFEETLILPPLIEDITITKDDVTIFLLEQCPGEDWCSRSKVDLAMLACRS